MSNSALEAGIPVLTEIIEVPHAEAAVEPAAAGATEARDRGGCSRTRMVDVPLMSMAGSMGNGIGSNEESADAFCTK